MRRLAFLSVVTTLLVVSTSVHASRESVLALANLHFESQGSGESGVVVVDVIQGEKGMQRFIVRAFGKSYQLADSQLKGLGPGQYNAIQVSCEEGYKETGGRTVYIRISMAFTSGEAHGKTVVIKEAGAVEVRDRL